MPYSQSASRDDSNLPSSAIALAAASAGCGSDGPAEPIYDGVAATRELHRQYPWCGWLQAQRLCSFGLDILKQLF
jgi:hypothetical protein